MLDKLTQTSVSVKLGCDCRADFVARTMLFRCPSLPPRGKRSNIAHVKDNHAPVRITQKNRYQYAHCSKNKIDPVDHRDLNVL